MPPTDDDVPRPHTIEEMRKMLLDHIDAQVRYWRNVKLEDSPDETLERMEGLVHSMLCVFDGVAGGMPSFDIVPTPHADDAKFYQDNHENWWPTGEAINDCSLHDMWGARRRKEGT